MPAYNKLRTELERVILAEITDHTGKAIQLLYKVRNVNIIPLRRLCSTIQYWKKIMRSDYIWERLLLHVGRSLKDCSNYSGTSLLRSPTGLGKSDLNVEVTLLPGVICTVEYNLGLSQGDCNWEVFLLVR